MKTSNENPTADQTLAFAGETAEDPRTVDEILASDPDFDVWLSDRSDEALAHQMTNDSSSDDIQF